MRSFHINLWELRVAKEWLTHNLEIQEMGAWFGIDNVTAVQSLQRQSTALLTLTEEIFTTAVRRALSLSARYVRGRENIWPDILFQFRGTSVEWQQCPQVCFSLTLWFSYPEIDLFAS